jgi:hypothetical protein
MPSASGKTVLFVSEKTAALQVVYGRLKAAGLGDLGRPGLQASLRPYLSPALAIG